MSRLLFSDLPADQVALLGHSHDPLLVVLSYLVASAAAFTALALAKRVSRSGSPRGRDLWRWVGAFALGGGIWSMHFIGMLAFSAPLDISYDHRITLLSLLIAMAVSYVVMRLLGRDRLSVPQYALAGTAAGFGIAAMHYTGMAAIRSLATLYYAPLAFAASVLIAIGASIAALVLGYHFRASQSRHQHWQRLLCSLLMGAAIVSMHYTGMHALTMAVPAHMLEHTAPFGSHGGQHAVLASAIGLVALLVIVTGIAASWAEQRFSEQRQALDQAEHQLNAMTHYDPLTNLFNGRAFTEMVTQVLAAREERQALAVLVVDLDNFKRINDSLGHRSGDLALQQAAHRIRAVLGQHDMLARFSGDEFCVLTLGQWEQAQALANHILEQLRPPFTLGDTQLRLTASIGISQYPEDGLNFDALFRHAGLAVGQCKASGRNRSLRFNPALELRAQEDLSLEQDLRRALNENLLSVNYQPIVDGRSGEPVSLEALVRWQHPQQGFISPERFVGLAEQHGFVAELDAWVARRACADLVALLDEGYDLRVAVNCSALNLSNLQMPEVVARILERTGLDPARLTVEVTENALMNSLGAAVRTLDAVRELGVKVSIDDFGSGYSSLAYLRKLPVDTLKVDRAFVQEIAEQANDRAITAAIIAMAHKLGLKVVAEGVEEEVQLAYLRENGCDYIQGYYYSRPLPLSALRDWLAARRPLTAGATIA
ncbi:MULTISPECIES: putative bifunctional diguanylate cyclase/phosphodiesterase [Stutzerimonas stutzeri subgroup]|uniref:cyclic-guanylate-specific phosphodiesterase n=1 Tax=Stutzerimonas kunmingensis TaxID=1211807 RepID=A0A9X1N4P6_9GAMM|nr:MULTISPECIES: bifunctional diguanylate cyclase/phosphodiesterase [Stutzerimonas stutzeri subgroup]MCD1608194.1 EAL domain-containing protein [Stutzerimonas kunmingensis]PNG00225.1 bifunctional diguanylate cyclase/phosphodiesterase [Stutzerimonas kunmingensis]UEG60987.1 EAL domain-containing protein [Stutzerimonas chloritidismutans]